MKILLLTLGALILGAGAVIILQVVSGRKLAKTRQALPLILKNGELEWPEVKAALAKKGIRMTRRTFHNIMLRLMEREEVSSRESETGGRPTIFFGPKTAAS